MVKTTNAPSGSEKLPISGVTNVAIIGAGHGGTALMEDFCQRSFGQIIVRRRSGCAGARSSALAKRLKIPVTRDYQRLLESNASI